MQDEGVLRLGGWRFPDGRSGARVRGRVLQMRPALRTELTWSEPNSRTPSAEEDGSPSGPARNAKLPARRGHVPAYRRLRDDDRRAQDACEEDANLLDPHIELIGTKYYVRLEHDCYAISIVEGVPVWAAISLPLASACGQFAVLYFMAEAHENMFDEGRWLEPVSVHTGLNVMKFLAILVSLFKVSTELQHAQQLYRALRVGQFQQNRKLLCGWWALVLQYFMTLSVLFVASSVVLAAQTCSVIMGKVLSVFVIVDMDNLMARFIEVLCTIVFVMPADKEALADFRRHERLVGQVFRWWFMVVPVSVVVIEVMFSIMYQVPPLTILKHGFVSNRAAPSMFEGMPETCCPPLLVAKFDDPADFVGSIYTYNVVSLAPPGAPPPRIHWIALEVQAEPNMPSSLQVVEGKDGDGNIAIHKGSADSRRVQIAHWLQVHGYQRDTYLDMKDRKSLFKRWVPFEANVTLAGLTSSVPSRFGAAFELYAVAQNPQSGALAKSPSVSARLLESICAPRCDSCAIAGAGRCDRCSHGAHRTSDGQCLPCPKHCKLCDTAARTMTLQVEGESMFSSQQSRTMPCDVGGCESGYGFVGGGSCEQCKVQNCLSCEGDTSICRECTKGFGLGVNGSCQPCAAEHCICMNANDCDYCTIGWGFTVNGTCSECPEGCEACTFAHDGICQSCKPGYAFDNGTSGCLRCPKHCLTCAVAGASGCDECQIGFGYNKQSGTCVPCEVDHCWRCDGARPDKCLQCEDGTGVTPDGKCATCGDFCRLCGEYISKCQACHQGFALQNGECWSCGDWCQNCTQAGPARCDDCILGYTLDNATRTCVPRFRRIEV